MTMTQARIPGPPPAPDLSTFHSRLAYIAEDAGVSNSEIARQIGEPIQTYLTWVRGDAHPGNALELVARIFDKFGYDPVWLAWGPEMVERLRGVTLGYPQCFGVKGRHN